MMMMMKMTNEDGDLFGNETVNEWDKGKNLFPKLAKAALPHNFHVFFIIIIIIIIIIIFHL